MQNVGSEQFTFDSFKAAYDSDPTIKPLVKNFNKDGIEPATQAQSPEDDTDGPEVGDNKGDTVGQMAKRATDLSDL